MEDGLVLGWQVTSGLDPRYWLRAGAIAGNQPNSEMVFVSTASLANHGAIVAQSGSGKSFFLGRLIEEMMLTTKCRCIIFDPNADFRRIHEAEPEGLWRDACYDPIRRLGKLPHEKNRQGFTDRWDKVSKCIFTSPHEATEKGAPYKPLRVPLTSLSVEFLTEDLAPSFRAQVEHCHSFVESLAEILDIRFQTNGQSADLLEHSEDLLQNNIGLSDHEFGLKLDLLLRPTPRKNTKFKPGRFPFLNSDLPIKWKLDLIGVIRQQAKKSMLSSRRYTSREAILFYLARAHQYVKAQLLYTEVGKYDYLNDEQWRLCVVDLPALPEKSIRQLAINALLKEEWQRAQKNWSLALGGDYSADVRVPTIIVVDEAHNLIPANPITREEALIREQFRTIVAEGRKFGVFLLVITQRPDKVDPMVLGECQNKAIMRLSSTPVLEMTRQALNVEDIPRQMLERVLAFESGRVILSGPWALDKPVTFYCCARRTAEGGRNLRSEYWSLPEEDLDGSHAGVS